jgi:phage terminase Nu1 subunit (DNA packaging protein)
MIAFDPDQHVSAGALAKVFGLTLRRIQQMAQDGTIPRAGRGVFALAASVQALLQYRQSAAENDGSINPEKLDPFRRRAYYQGEADRLRLLEMAGQLVRRADHERELARVFKILAHFFETVPDRIERDLNLAPLVVAKFEEYLDQLRRDLHDGVAEEVAQPAAEAEEQAA